MITGVFITARLGSSRLKKKHLLLVDHQPILTVLLSRIYTEFRKEIEEGNMKLIIATSDEIENREFLDLKVAPNYKAEVFFGSKNNIPLRHLQAAKSHSIDKIISIDGDDILCSVSAMRKVFDALKTHSYVKTDGLPFGMNCFGYSTKFLEKSINESSEEVLETGWGRIFTGETALNISLGLSTDFSHHRYTLDYPEDYDFFKNAIELIPNLNTTDDNQISIIVESNKLYMINKVVHQRYWENFNAGVQQERR